MLLFSLKRMKGCPEVFIIVSFGLFHRLNSPRIAIAVEPYPNRWTHHMIVFEAEQLDDELIGWLQGSLMICANQGKEPICGKCASEVGRRKKD